MATHSSILAWRIPWTEEPGKYSPGGRKESDTTEWLHLHQPCFRDEYKDQEVWVVYLKSQKQ